MKAKKYQNVELQFLHPEEASEMLATVLVREGEMVLDVTDPDYNVTDYLIIGKFKDYYFTGRNSATGDVSKVSATWTRLGQSYVGKWIEDGMEHLFTFELKA